MTDTSQEHADAPNSGAGASSESAPDALEALRAEKEALQDRLLRTAAEFDNYRKRVERERREHAESLAENILLDLLPIVDDLERALQAPVTADSQAYRAGVELIHRQMVDLLRRRGATPIETGGADFDPRFHQAVSQEASDAHREGQVIEEFRKGYMLGDRLLRAAMVKVASS